MGDFSQGMQGAAGGAMMGSMLGPWGSLGGGLLGGLGGLFGDGGQSQYQDLFKQYAQQYQNRGAPGAGNASQSGYSGFRQDQAGLIAQLEAMARGEGPSAASMQMRQAMDRAAAAQSSAAAGAGGRGVNAGAALRNATNQTAAVQSQNARDTGMMRVNEQLGAMNQLGGTIAQGRGADEATNMFNAGQNNQFSLADLQSKLQTMGMNDQMFRQMMMGAAGVAGPGMGTQMMAGGAMAFPGILQYLQRQGGQGGGQTGGFQWPWQSGPVTSPDQV